MCFVQLSLPAMQSKFRACFSLLTMSFYNIAKQSASLVIQPWTAQWQWVSRETLWPYQPVSVYCDQPPKMCFMDLWKQRDLMESNFFGCAMNMEMFHCPTLCAPELSTSLEQKKKYSWVYQNGGGAKARAIYTSVMIWLIEHFYWCLL